MGLGGLTSDVQGLTGTAAGTHADKRARDLYTGRFRIAKPRPDWVSNGSVDVQSCPRGDAKPPA
jgi:hypothetical protein